MPTQITTGNLGWPLWAVLHIITQVSSRLSPNGTYRLVSKSADDVLSAALSTAPPLCDKPKCLYFNGSEPKEVSQEARDADKRLAVWKASVEYAELTADETCLHDWA